MNQKITKEALHTTDVKRTTKAMTTSSLVLATTEETSLTSVQSAENLSTISVHRNDSQTTLPEKKTKVSNLDLHDLITFTCINIQSIKSKLDILEAELGDRDIIMLTESWLKPNISDKSVVLSNFKAPYRNDREGDKLRKVLFGLFYRSSDSPYHIWNHINQSIENAVNSDIESIVVMGDFNENLK
ncbi:unnamed protein product [Mytilus coruscus]|uniref:Endonuclease/exonuclease/phosphatase domain-containing protein n=1 Tax=Mytilus coruscus TaxID=42192 RepID=A0A6J8A098_MYTCO|nr:unnamed protein product [Mytilus coruscus]